MAIVAFDNAAFQSSGVSAAAQTILLTVTSGATLLVAMHSNETGTLSSVNAGGVGCTLLGYTARGNGNTQIWGLTSPAAGTLTISARLAGTTQAIWCLAAASYVGQRTVAGSPFSTAISANSNGTSMTYSISSSVDDMVVTAFGTSAVSAITIPIGYTERGSATASTTGRVVWADIAGTTGLMTFTASSAATLEWTVLAINIIASASAATAWKYTLGMMGVGR